MSKEKRHFEFTAAEFPFDDMERRTYLLNKVPVASTGEIYLLALKGAIANLGYTSLKVVVREASGVMPQGGVTFSRTDERPLQLLHANHGFRPVFSEDFSDPSISLALKERIKVDDGEEEYRLLRFSSSLENSQVNNHAAAASFFKIAGRFVMKQAGK